MLNKNLHCAQKVRNAFDWIVEHQNWEAMNEYRDTLSKRKDCNKTLCDEFPFLAPQSVWADDEWVEKDDERWAKKYDYDCTELDDIETGWLKAFGLDLCVELKAALIKDGCLDTFAFDQIKEKYGDLRLYAHGYGNKSEEVLEKYGELSRFICKNCGKPATKISRGWVSPYCDDCATNLRIHETFTPIEECYEMLEPSVEKMIDRILYHYDHNDFWETL